MDFENAERGKEDESGEKHEEEIADGQPEVDIFVTEAQSVVENHTGAVSSEISGLLLPSEMVNMRKSLNLSLRKISTLTCPDIVEEFDPNSLPASYRSNEGKEIRVLQYCRTFLKQYNHLCNNRCRILLKPRNEMGIEKLVCTTIIPTQLPFKELLDWPEIAEFVSGYLIYRKLRPPNLLPNTLFSPQTTLQTLRGHCFEYSTVLCSMLIGAGYDAFVVSGYATKEVCDLNVSYAKCPFVEDDQLVYTRPIMLDICRYKVRPPRQYKSEYELRMFKKKQEVFKREEDEAIAAKNEKIKISEAPPPDEFRGYRVHSWVMVLKGNRDVQTTFFIEPTTGMAHATDWEEYLGIECLWNHRNYYINMQNRKLDGVDNLKYDIGDSCDWEYIFPNQDLHLQHSAEELFDKKLQIAISGDTCAEESHLDLPLSWSLPLSFSRNDYMRQYPNGKRSRRYKYTLVDEYCRYINTDGLVRKIRRYNDLACEDLSYTREIYKDRADMLEMRFLHVRTGKIIENFGIGRQDFIREHIYLAYDTAPEKWRIIQYEKNKRVDGQIKREEGSLFIKQSFQGRDDRKYYKETIFGPRGKIFENPLLLTKTSRAIEVITECYNRNPAIPANSDVAKITYSVGTDDIDIEYHVEDERIIYSTRHFTKPSLWWDETQILAWTPELHWCFEADLFVQPKGELELYQMLIELMAAEAVARTDVRKMEIEMKQCLEQRDREEEESQLLMSYVQADTDDKLRTERLMLKAQKKAEMILAKSDTLKDYLEPYMIKIGLQKISNKKQAVKVRDDCMLSLKDRLICQANIIKDSFAKQVELIETAQDWYHTHFTTLSKQDITDYRVFLMQHTFTAHILERRLISLKEYAPIKYHALYDTLAKDPRLEQFVI